ncbi:hypothetical protein NL676_037431 [Syzygium grande]|nr:hypothetical protein NL676_037431 [Syzygium grande]
MFSGKQEQDQEVSLKLDKARQRVNGRRNFDLRCDRIDLAFAVFWFCTMAVQSEETLRPRKKYWEDGDTRLPLDNQSERTGQLEVGPPSSDHPQVLGLEENCGWGAGAGPSQNPVDDSYMSDSSKKASNISNPQPKDAFHVKSGIWTDSLSRGLIDLNISASKKVSLADVGVVGGLSDGSDERERGPPTSFYMGRAMGTGTDLGMSSFTSSLSRSVETTSSQALLDNLNTEQHFWYDVVRIKSQ